MGFPAKTEEDAQKLKMLVLFVHALKAGLVQRVNFSEVKLKNHNDINIVFVIILSILLPQGTLSTKNYLVFERFRCVLKTVLKMSFIKTCFVQTIFSADSTNVCTLDNDLYTCAFKQDRTESQFQWAISSVRSCFMYINSILKRFKEFIFLKINIIYGGNS